MNTHYLKILPEHYNNVLARTKTFEIRKNDRAFQKGDEVVLRAFNGESYLKFKRHDGNYSYPDIKAKIGDVYPIDSERVVFSLLNLEELK